ncbi:MAG: two-component sensor histidine kinase [Cyanobacteria bacterium RYN_339]|nr:two-component sensor histidine kinase [Cyanobacteria bacterium RYN_339]
MSASGIDERAFRQLRTRLALWNTGAFAIVLVAFALACLAMVDRASERALDEANQASVEELIGTLRPGRVPLDLKEFVEEARELRESGALGLAELYAPDGRLLASAFKATEGLAAGPRRETITVGGRHMRVVRIALPAGGTVVVARNTAGTDELRSLFSLGLALAVPLALLLTAVAGRFLAGKAARPVKVMLEHQRRFMADASHELRTPLAVILSSAEVALEDPHPTLEAQADSLARVGRTGRRMAHLVDDLLFLSQSEGLARAEWLAFDLAELLADLVEERQAVASATDVTIQLDAPAVLEVEAEPTQLGRGIGNLIDNAVKFSPAGGTVRVQLLDEGGRGCAVAVHDEGPGIPPEEHAHVFERFYRGRAVTATGTGLGLSIARAIAVAHGGRLTLVSTVGHGSTFTLWLAGKGQAWQVIGKKPT